MPSVNQRRRLVAISSPPIAGNSWYYENGGGKTNQAFNFFPFRAGHMRESKLASIPEEESQIFGLFKQRKRMVPPNIDGFIVESADPRSNKVETNATDFSEFRFEHINICDYYSQHFLGQEHHNIIFLDTMAGPSVLSLKREAGGLAYRAILRNSLGSKCAVFDCTQTGNVEAASLCVSVARQLDARLSKFEVEPVTYLNCLDASQQILSYDEKIESKTFKFGVVLQKRGQNTEEQILHNCEHNEQFTRFLETIADRVSLKNFDHYRGGLDTSDNAESYYTTFKGKEIMFHVCTMLPLTPGDHQQLQRKRHIGNDIVIVVFQDSNDVTFSPDMLQSNFIHCIIVVQPVFDKELAVTGKYRITVMRREDVPSFGPPIPSELVAGERLRSFLLTKLIHAEYACYRANRFLSLQTRTRLSLLQSLINGLRPDIEWSEDKPNRLSSAIPAKTAQTVSLVTNVRRAFNRKFSSVLLSSPARAKSLPSEFPIELKVINEAQLDELEQKSLASKDGNNSTTPRQRSTSDANPSAVKHLANKHPALPKLRPGGVRFSADSLNDDVNYPDEGYCKDSGSDSPDRMISGLNSVGTSTAFDSDYKKTQALLELLTISDEAEV